MTDPHDPLLLYRTFEQAVREWMKDHAHRFVVPSIECWPEEVNSNEEAWSHYSEEAATEIIENWERIYNEEVSTDRKDSAHVATMKRGDMELRQCMGCHRLASANSGEPIDHGEDCPYDTEQTNE